MRKNRYVIYYSGVMEYGYVTLTWRKPKVDRIHYDSKYANMQHATKFRFKWVAKLVCNVLQRNTEYIRTFEVHDFKE